MTDPSLKIIAGLDNNHNEMLYHAKVLTKQCNVMTTFCRQLASCILKTHLHSASALLHHPISLLDTITKNIYQQQQPFRHFDCKGRSNSLSILSTTRKEKKG